MTTIPETLTVQISNPPIHFDPRVADDLISHDLLSQVFEGLTRFADASLAVEGGLAARWTPDATYLKWTFRLREGITFSDGTPITPELVAKSFTGGRDFGGVCEPQADGSVRITLREPSAGLPELLAQPFYNVVLDRAGLPPLGSGPYRFESDRRTSRDLVLVPNEHSRITPKIPRIVFRVNSFVTLLPKSLADGSVDVSDNITASLLPVLRNTPGVRVESQMGLDTGFLVFNCEHPKLKEPKIRLAAAHAIDKANILLKHFPTGMGEVATGLLPPTLDPAHGNERLPFDLEKSKRLLAEGGYRGEKLRLLPCWAPRPYMPDPSAIAAEVGACLKRAGFEITVEPVPDADRYFKREETGDYDLLLAGWIADDTLASNFLHENLSISKIGTNNVTRYRNAELDRLIAETRKLPAAAAAPKVKRILEIVAGEVPLVPLFHGPLLAAAGEKVKGRLLHPSLMLRLWTLTKG